MTQAEQILDLLRERGKRGATNFELMKISYQYPARIHTLRHKLGHEIAVTHVKDKEWHIRLVNDAEAVSSRPAGVEDLDPPEPVRTTIGEYMFKGRDPYNRYITMQTYSLTISKLEVGKPIKIIAPHPREYPDINHFNKEWRRVV